MKYHQHQLMSITQLGESLAYYRRALDTFPLEVGVDSMSTMQYASLTGIFNSLLKEMKLRHAHSYTVMVGTEEHYCDELYQKRTIETLDYSSMTEPEQLGAIQFLQTVQVYAGVANRFEVAALAWTTLVNLGVEPIHPDSLLPKE